jgi:hypothetical protein
MYRHLYVNVSGFARPLSKDAGYAYVLSDASGNPLGQHSGYLRGHSFTAAMYRALIDGLEAAFKAGAARMVVRTKSRSMVEQLEGSRPIFGETLLSLVRRVDHLTETALAVRYELVLPASDIAAPLAQDAYDAGPGLIAPRLRSGSFGANGRTG